MSGAKTAYLEQLQLNATFSGSSYNPPNPWWVALATDPFNVAAVSDNDFTEVAAQDYGRLNVPNGIGNFTTPTGANPTSLASTQAWVWPGIAFDWGLVRSFYLMDDYTGGHPWYGADLPGGGIPLSIGSVLEIPFGAFIVREGVPVA